jgi:uncharacterized protein YmfQ (DUF2313 family)
MNFYYKLRDILGNDDTVNAYKHFRYIEDWCDDNLKRKDWWFDHSFSVCVYGVDIPGGIYLRNLSDVYEFNLRCQ